MMLESNMQIRLLSLGLLLGVCPLARAETLAEWEFTQLKEGPIESVAAKTPGAPALVQKDDTHSPTAEKGIGPGGAEAAQFVAQKKQFLAAASGDAFEFGANEAFTVEAVIKLASVPPSNTMSRQIVGKRSSEGTFPGWALAVHSNGALLFVVATEGDSAKVVRSPDSLPLDEWVRVAGSRDDAGVLRLVINGEVVAEARGTGDSLKSGAPLLVGKHNTSQHPGFYFDGAIEALRISRGVVSPADTLGK